MAFSFVYPTPLPSTKGWGSGWPNCQDIANEGPSIFWPGVHPEIAELVSLLVSECERRGFVFMDPGCWGFGCRATKASNADRTGTPSFHSWGLGFDVNAPKNVYGAERHETQLGQPGMAWFIDLWHDYGFFWLGPAIKDWQHFSFVGSRADAAAMTKKARQELGGDMGFAEFAAGLRASRQNKPKPADDPDTSLGYGLGESVKAARKLPAPEAHDHDGYAKHPHVHGKDVPVV